jgi:hypothetical protein
MQLITHQSHLDALPTSDLKTHIQKRCNQLSQDSDVPPTIIILTPDTNFKSPALHFLGESGVYSDMLGEHHPRERGFQSVFDWISYQPSVPVYEMLFLESDLGYTFIFEPSVVDAHPQLKALIDSQPLSPPQPLY